MEKKTFKDIDVSGKKILVRVDFNVPVDDNNKITDETRILSSLPTINYLINQKSKVILCSHFGRPKGVINPKFSLAPIAKRLSELLKKEVKMATDVIGDNARGLINEMQEGDVILLENVRFHSEEEKNDEKFAKELASLADIFVNDAFGAAHRAHASTAGVAMHIPAVAGFLMSKEITSIGNVIKNPEKPFVVILGGAKVSDKIGVILKLLEKATVILIGGAMANTFIAAKGGRLGLSRYEKDRVDVAKSIMEEAEKKNVRIVLPVDEVVTREFSPKAKSITVDAFAVPDGYQGMDIGKKTIKLFTSEIKKAKTIIWNGPMGVYEFKKYQKGTKSLTKAVARSKAVSVVGGGDIVAAINASGFASKITHISTGGGATLEFLEGRNLPGVEMLEDRSKK